MKINEIGEFGLIGRIAADFKSLIPQGWEGIGDDCAVIPWNEDKSLVVTTDLLVENVHFLRKKITPYQLGCKSLAANLSDIAAMGAKPVATFLSIGLPSETVEVEWCDAFFDGYRSFGVPLLGGDTTSSPEGIVINITVLGMAENDHIKRRSDARPGDLIAVTGPLGDSAGGLQALLKNIPHDTDIKELIKRHHKPRPHLAEGEWLGTCEEVHAMMDVSDGVASDLFHILRASGVGAAIQTDAVPTSPVLRKIAGQQGWNAVELALTGGEDYVLLLTVDPARINDLQKGFEARFGHPLHVIGECRSGKPEITYRGTDNHFTGFEHF